MYNWIRGTVTNTTTVFSLRCIGGGLSLLTTENIRIRNNPDFLVEFHNSNLQSFPIVVNVICVPVMFSFHMAIKLSNEHTIWMRRLSFYLAIYIAVILISRFIFLKFNLLHTDVDSARYMLSAMIQSEAAIIAIVVTMSLVAAQLAASLYSVRVINIFRNSPDLWILLLIYGIALFWGLGVLKLVNTAGPSTCASDLICQSNLQGHIALTYSLGIFAFVALAPYMWNIFGMLNASTITTKCAKNVTKQSILKSITADNDFF